MGVWGIKWGVEHKVGVGREERVALERDAGGIESEYGQNILNEILKIL